MHVHYTCTRIRVICRFAGYKPKVERGARQRGKSRMALGLQARREFLPHTHLTQSQNRYQSIISVCSSDTTSNSLCLQPPRAPFSPTPSLIVSYTLVHHVEFHETSSGKILISEITRYQDVRASTEWGRGVRLAACARTISLRFLCVLFTCYVRDCSTCSLVFSAKTFRILFFGGVTLRFGLFFCATIRRQFAGTWGGCFLLIREFRIREPNRSSVEDLYFFGGEGEGSGADGGVFAIKKRWLAVERR